MTIKHLKRLHLTSSWNNFEIFLRKIDGARLKRRKHFNNRRESLLRDLTLFIFSDFSQNKKDGKSLVQSLRSSAIFFKFPSRCRYRVDRFLQRPRSFEFSHSLHLINSQQSAIFLFCEINSSRFKLFVEQSVICLFTKTKPTLKTIRDRKSRRPIEEFYNSASFLLFRCQVTKISSFT